MGSELYLSQAPPVGVHSNIIPECRGMDGILDILDMLGNLIFPIAGIPSDAADLDVVQDNDSRDCLPATAV
jgi:hypothetical protein